MSENWTKLGAKFLKIAKNKRDIRCYQTHLELRKSFYAFFESKNHRIVKSASVVPEENDGTLLFTNAGMNQFKSRILSSTESQRVANIQKCIRAGGKHNDLDDVGKDLHHQTFFEMMGNWSFNDAFSRREACYFAWEYLTNVLGIDSDRLYVSYFGGIKSLGLPEDRECLEIWKEIGVPPDRILPFVSENFWEMGAAGPCGPCTEIHYDRIGGRNAASLVNVDDSVVEIWNIVFMSNLKDSSGRVLDLGKNHIDTGMGFERLLSVVQNKNSNFETDVFSPILEKISALTDNRLIYSGSLSKQEDAAFRLIADHVRAVCIAISDGALPDGTGSGFIVRKMMRRAFLQGTSKLDIDRFALGDLVPTVVSTLKDVYPELQNSFAQIERIFKEEEAQFWKKVDAGKKMFDQVVAERKSPIISGKKAFYLFETFGLPLSVTIEMARNIGREVDEKEFEKCQKDAQKLSKNASHFKMPISAEDFPSHSDKAKYLYTFKDQKYEFPNVKTNVLGVYKEHERVEKLEENDKGFVVVEDCQFYAEQGGQTSDTGQLLIDDEVVFEVENAKKVAGGISVLYGHASRPIRSGSCVEQRLDKKRREGVMRAHSATHLLNWGLQKKRLSGGQKGSSVYCDRLRFDYSTSDEFLDKDGRVSLLEECEATLNNFIRNGGITEILETSIEEARKMENLQSEVKADRIGTSTVRVVALGSGGETSIECCSGTHVHTVRSIGEIAFISDKSTGHKLRRITALTGEEAKNCREYAERVMKEVEPMSQKDRSLLSKKIEWNRIPLSYHQKISKLVKQKNSKSQK